MKDSTNHGHGDNNNYNICVYVGASLVGTTSIPGRTVSFVSLKPPFGETHTSWASLQVGFGEL